MSFLVQIWQCAKSAVSRSNGCFVYCRRLRMSRMLKSLLHGESRAPHLSSMQVTARLVSLSSLLLMFRTGRVLFGACVYQLRRMRGQRRDNDDSQSKSVCPPRRLLETEYLPLWTLQNACVGRWLGQAGEPDGPRRRRQARLRDLSRNPHPISVPSLSPPTFNHRPTLQLSRQPLIFSALEARRPSHAQHRWLRINPILRRPPRR